MKYAVVIEKTGNGYGASIPDLPGCIAISDTLDEVRSDIKVAMKMHLDAMVRDGDHIPEPSRVEFVEVDVKTPA